MTIISSETRIEKAKQEHNSTIIFFHGMTLNNNCVSHFNSNMQEKFPHTKFIFPQASQKEWKVKGMFSSECSNWYTIEGERNHLFVTNPPQTIEEVEKWSEGMKINEAHLKATVLGVHQLIQAEIDSGIKPENIIIAGYSQGGSAALATGLTFKKPLGGIISLSSFLPWSPKTYNLLNNASSEKKEVPIMFCNGTDDGLVPFWTGEMSAKILKSCNYSKVEFHGYQNQGHSTNCDKELNSFLERILLKKRKDTEEENNSNTPPKPKKPKFEEESIENRQNDNLSVGESQEKPNEMKNPPIPASPAENSDENLEDKIKNQKPPNEKEKPIEKNDNNNDDVYENWTYEQLVNEIKKLKLEINRLKADKNINSFEKQRELKIKLEKLEKIKADFGKNPNNYNNKSPAGLVMGGLVLLATIGLAVFLVIRSKKKNNY